MVAETTLFCIMLYLALPGEILKSWVSLVDGIRLRVKQGKRATALKTWKCNFCRELLLGAPHTQFR